MGGEGTRPKRRGRALRGAEECEKHGGSVCAGREEWEVDDGAGVGTGTWRESVGDGFGETEKVLAFLVGVVDWDMSAGRGSWSAPAKRLGGHTQPGWWARMVRGAAEDGSWNAAGGGGGVDRLHASVSQGGSGGPWKT